MTDTRSHATEPNPGEPDLDLLLALEALLQENNVTRAAARLKLSQPALSARLARLRQLFDDPLFVPAANGRGVVPTARALDLQDALAHALRSLRDLSRRPQAFDPRTSRRTFVIAVQEQPAAVLAPSLVRTVLSEAPEIRLALVYPQPGALERLENGTLDLLIAPAAPTFASLMGRTLFDDDLLVAQRKEHPRGRGALDLDGFCSLDHLVVSTDGAGFSGQVDRALSALGRRRRVALSIQSYSLAPLVVAGSDCICTLPSRLLRPYADRLDLFAPPIDLPRPCLTAMWHPRSHGDRGHGWLRDALYRAAGAAPPAGDAATIEPNCRSA